MRQMKFYFDKNDIIKEINTYFSLKGKEDNLGPAEIPKAKEYAKKFLNAIEKIQGDGYLKANISKDELTELIHKNGTLHKTIAQL
ncbi:MAG TPA: hypothetical protein DHV62_01880, partial [Elusimicrobia bacterium]|nr:hypothetical protein [Elusimicrobiota bacterium]